MLKKNLFSKTCILLALAWSTGNILNYKEYRNGGEWGPFKHDMFAYYVYLPAIFVYDGDLQFNFTRNIPENNPVNFWPTETPTGKVINKVTIGMATMMSPFFLLGHAYAKITEGHSNEKADGYSKPYRIMMVVGAFFYVFMGLFFMRSVLLRFFSDQVVGWSLLSVMLGTNLFFYTVHEQMMSHAYSFFLYAAFILLTIRWYENPRLTTMLGLGAMIAFIALVRPTNILISLFFLLYGIKQRADIKERLLFWYRHFGQIIIAAVLAAAIIFPQLLYIKTQSGQWFFYTYAPWERFYWTEPAILEGLFGYCKGWYVYTPLMFIATLGFIWVRKYAAEVFLPLILFYVLNVYVVLSWWSWWYGGGFGLRAFVEAGAPMLFGLAAIIQRTCEMRRPWRYGIILSLFLCIALNLFQTLQYRKAILRWNGMTRERYWAIFGKAKLTEEEFKAVDKMVKEPSRKK